MSLDTTLGEMLAKKAATLPDKEAIVYPGDQLTYAQFNDRSTEIAKALLADGVRSGDHIGILATNRTEYLPFLFGCFMVGAVAVLLNARFRIQELRHVVKHCDVTRLFAGNLPEVPHVERLTEAFPELTSLPEGGLADNKAAPLLRRVIVFDDNGNESFGTWGAFLSSASAVSDADLAQARRAVDPTQPALIMFTSGTTSMPKGCVLTHKSLYLTSAAMRDRLFITAQERMWDPLPMFHMASILPLLSLMHDGGTFITDSTVDVDRAVAQIHRERATFLYPAFPAIMTELLNHPGLQPQTLDFVRIIVNIAPEDILKANMAAIPTATHVSAYGMTELSGIASHTDPRDSAEDRARNCGQPYTDVELEMRDPETNAVCLQGERGEICVRGFSVFEGYYKQPEENDKAFDAQGWFHTGDVGSLDEHGRIRFHGRIKDMLKVGGENVSPLEIEAWLTTHPEVVIAQVVGAPDPRLQEVVAAFVERVPGATVSEQDLIDYCSGQIASFKVPKIVRFVTEWPMSATKIQKSELRKLL